MSSYHPTASSDLKTSAHKIKKNHPVYWFKVLLSDPFHSSFGDFMFALTICLLKNEIKYINK